MGVSNIVIESEHVDPGMGVMGSDGGKPGPMVPPTETPGGGPGERPLDCLPKDITLDHFHREPRTSMNIINCSSSDCYT